MTKKRRDIRRAFRRGKQRVRKLKRAGVPPELLDTMKGVLGKDPTVQDAQEFQLEMAQVVLQRLVEVRLAQWIEAVLVILRDEFEFSEIQLAHFARLFMAKTGRMVEDEQEKAAPDNGHA